MALVEEALVVERTQCAHSNPFPGQGQGRAALALHGMELRHGFEHPECQRIAQTLEQRGTERSAADLHENAVNRKAEHRELIGKFVADRGTPVDREAVLGTVYAERQLARF